MMDYETVRAKVLYVPSPEKAYNSKVPYEVGSKLLRSQKKIHVNQYLQMGRVHPTVKVVV